MGKSSTASKQKYNKKAYDRLYVTVLKGQGSKIKSYAESQGKSLNAYINDLIKNDMGDLLQVPSHSEQENNE